MPPLGKADLGAMTFCASIHPNDKCGANGLPLTPNSIKMLGRFQKLKSLEHPRLCKYIDLIRGKHERVIVVAEHYKGNLSMAAKSGKFSDAQQIIQLAHDILEGLGYLNKQSIVHRNLSPDNILFDSLGNVKLSKYGMYHMTDHGGDVAFPIGKMPYLAPEVIATGPVQVTINDYNISELNRPPSGPKVDVWALGIILLEIILEKKLWSHLTMQQVFHKVIGLLQHEACALDSIVKDHRGEDKIKDLPAEVLQLLKTCLTVCARKRPNPTELLQHSAFQDLEEIQVPDCGFNMFSTKLRCKNLEIIPYDDIADDIDTEDPLSERYIEEVYYLWRLAGGELETVLKKAGLIKSKQPIMTLAKFVVEDGELFGQVRDRSTLLDDTVVTLSLDQLRQRLEQIDAAAYYPLLEEDCNIEGERGLPNSVSNFDLAQTATLPVVIKEKDIEYQFHRIILFDRLLQAYPYKRTHIKREARLDIPPLVRSYIWAALLEVEGDVYGQYDAIDKETPTNTDRQIEVDIPRCHQYNELLSSPEGHGKFKRLLKAWIVSHPEYVYWQGLDSLCAPFLYLNFNDEAVAYACLAAFIPKYLNKFFLKDNSSVIQEYLAVFSHLIAFHDPELSNHLDGIGFIPDLYSIPWFLTMYAHVFPLHKVFHLWDTLLLGDSSFPLCIGVAILKQLRDQLLSFGFNECILLFSDMPEIDIQRCVEDSKKIFCGTPRSATYRQHAQSKKSGDKTNRGRQAKQSISKEHEEKTKSELAMEPIPLEDLKAEKCARVSAEDLKQLCHLGGTNGSTQSSKPNAVVIDVRSQEERGTFPGGINMPFQTSFGPDGELLPSPAVQTLNSCKNLVKVVIGSRGKNAVNFAEALLRLKYFKVCVLHKGVDVLRTAGLLVVPPPEL